MDGVVGPQIREGTSGTRESRDVSAMVLSQLR